MAEKKRRKPQSAKQKDSIPYIELDVSKLPSRGISYPQGATIKYRTYTFGEIRKASTSSVGTRSSIQLALSGIVTNFSSRNLTFIDCLYIGILRKISSLNGIEFEIPYICKACKSQSKGRFTQNDIEFRDISDEVTSLPICIDVAGQELQFNPMTVGDFLNITNGSFDKVFKEGKLDRVAVQAVAISNMEFEDAYKLLYDIDDRDDIEVLTEIDRLLLHDIKPLKISCTNRVEDKSCNGENLIKLEGREVLINPFRKSEGASRTRIRFGTSSKPELSSD